MVPSLFDTKAKSNSTLFELIMRTFLNSHKSSVATWQCCNVRVARNRPFAHKWHKLHIFVKCSRMSNLAA
ncbi:unnamed protein product [Ixodes pacificus]